MALLILVNTMLLSRKLLFLNFTGEYSSKFSEGSLENWAFLMRPKKCMKFFSSKNVVFFIKFGFIYVFSWGKIDFDPYLNLTGDSLPKPLEVVKPVLVV